MDIHKQIQLPLIKTILCFICFDQRETHIRASNDRFIKLQVLSNNYPLTLFGRKNYLNK
jgi:hypothetical protein